MKNPFAGLTSAFSKKDDKPAEEAQKPQQKPEATKPQPVKAPSFLGVAANLANQANKPAVEAQKKPEEVKKETAQNPAPAQTPAQATPQENLNVLYPDTRLFHDSRDIAIDGVLPGIAFNKVVAVFGEPIDRGENTFSFSNGMTVETDDAKSVVKKISVISGEIITPEGVAVNMEETILNTTYETADEVDVKSNGADYKYFNKAKTRKFTFISRDGYITKIISELIK